MCGCASEHGGSACGSSGCHCHDDSIEKVLGPEADTFVAPSEEIYMTISFPKVSRRKAVELQRMLLATVGLISYNVYINEDPDEETDED